VICKVNLLWTKGKVIVVPVLNYYAMKAYGEVTVQIHVFLTSTQVGSVWSDSRLGHFTPGERAPDTHGTGSWAGPRISMGNVGKKKFLPLPGFKL
jgi:hypothetical protein